MLPASALCLGPHGSPTLSRQLRTTVCQQASVLGRGGVDVGSGSTCLLQWMLAPICPPFRAWDSLLLGPSSNLVTNACQYCTEMKAKSNRESGGLRLWFPYPDLLVSLSLPVHTPGFSRFTQWVHLVSGTLLWPAKKSWLSRSSTMMP